MQTIKATLEKIVYYNEENNYLVARCSFCEPQKGSFTIVGNLNNPTPGVVLEIQGEWSFHPKYGKQFKIQSYTRIPPTTPRGIEKYLGSGIIEKIGPGMAARIVKHFGQQTLNIIEKNPDKLEEVEGIGPRRKESIISALEKQKKTKEVMLYLYSLGIGSSTANKIYNTYKDEAPQKIQENPYRLIEDIFGIGFKTADSIARDIGIEKESPLRIKAGIHHILLQSTEKGHTFLPYFELKEKVAKLLEVEEKLVENAITSLRQRKEVIVEDESIYHPKFYLAEIEVAKKLRGLINSGNKTLPLKWENMVNWLEKSQGIKLSPDQKMAIKKAITDKVMVLTGGPGTGKTTTVKSIVHLFEQLGLKVLLAAPTGRAAKRLSEATEKQASTIHRLLGFVPGQGFTKNEKNKLRADVVIVDEVSMIDLLLMNALLKALPLSCRLILVGDADQLPAIGAGNVLQDIIRSMAVSVVRLEEIFRQAKTSLIVVNAHRINKGEFPYLPRWEIADKYTDKKDFYFLNELDSTKAEQIIVNLCCREIPEKFGFDPFKDIQIISPLYRGYAGVNRLNSILQKILNPERTFLSRGQIVFKIGDKVMQLKNNYEKEVFNGDIGKIVRVNKKDEVIEVEFPEKRVIYQGQDINQITLAYAISVHKSQGTEYPVILMPLFTSHYLMLQRNLLYTALTRAKRLAIIVGEKKALAIAIRNDKMARRYTKLKQRIASIAGENKILT
ncbi:ATP-dependent RecD-like DNA helicase [Candidatus Aerophobetes bacterium]|uniref:ATP-dependent RecD-like DNA helicase n=1 Tax=Aerophobetes bacterium TaxID=2030807 RepID=A0A662D5G4_UNCAE|nr:MAG: ATP-dependent RecD-like DNA helicase [Candidatus Aerophobetes bacterium]